MQINQLLTEELILTLKSLKVSGKVLILSINQEEEGHDSAYRE